MDRILSDGGRAIELASKEVILIGDSSLIVGRERLVVCDYFGEISDGLAAVCGVMSVAITIVADGVWFWSFPSGAIQVVI